MRKRPRPAGSYVRPETFAAAFLDKNPLLHDVFVCTIGSRHRLDTPNILWFCLCSDDIECYTFDMETRRASVSFSDARHAESRAPCNGLGESESTRDALEKAGPSGSSKVMIRSL